MLAAALSASVGTAWAQTDEQRAGARSLATEGAQAFNEGRFKDAVDYFGKAESLVHAPPHLLFMARAHAKLGQLVVAREAYLKIIKETFPANAPQAFRDAQTSAAEEVKAIEPRLGTLTVRVEGGAGATDTAVLLDGTPMPSILIGAPRPTDPGEHKLEAGATGLRSAPTTIVVGDGERKSVTLLLQPAPGAPPLVVAPDAAPPPAPAARTAAPAATTTSPTSDAGAANDKSGLRIGSYVAFGVGVLGVGAGTLFTLQSSSKRSDADEKFEECGGATGCTQDNPLSQEVEELDPFRAREGLADAGELGVERVLEFPVCHLTGGWTNIRMIVRIATPSHTSSTSGIGADQCRNTPRRTLPESPDPSTVSTWRLSAGRPDSAAIAVSPARASASAAGPATPCAKVSARA
jgi:hypothetical protein